MSRPVRPVAGRGQAGQTSVRVGWRHPWCSLLHDSEPHGPGSSWLCCLWFPVAHSLCPRAPATHCKTSLFWRALTAHSGVWACRAERVGSAPPATQGQGDTARALQTLVFPYGQLGGGSLLAGGLPAVPQLGEADHVQPGLLGPGRHPVLTFLPMSKGHPTTEAPLCPVSSAQPCCPR